MPKENKRRGRRMKRKHEDDDDVDTQQPSETQQHPSKRTRSAEPDENIPDYPQNDAVFSREPDDLAAAYPSEGHEPAFFGVLDEDEQEYFKHADELLETNSFATAEERGLFLESVYREAEGKELKIAQSQSCSRLLERLIKQSTAAQLKNLFQKFSGNFIHLLSHRFASHCCEALFAHAAPYVSEEFLSGKTEEAGDSAKPSDPNAIYVSMENLFLYTLAELEGNIGYLLTDPYASHALRVLLLILTGESVWSDATKHMLRSKKKEDIASDKQKTASKPRAVPKSFSAALEKLIGDSVAGLDTPKLRALATHPIANPTLQLLLRLELSHYGKQRAKDEASIIKKLLPDDPFTAESESAGFIGGLAYDPVGAYLVERIIEYAPAKLFKSLYQNFFKERLAAYARNEVATYVACRILERLGYDDLLDAHETLLPVVPTLLERRWTALPRTLIERCTVRDIDTQAIAATIDQYYQGTSGFDLRRMLEFGLDSDTEAPAPTESQTPAEGANYDINTNATRTKETSKVHFNILAQAMLIVPGSLSSLILDALISLGSDHLLKMAKDPIASRTLQQGLTTHNSGIIERRKLIQKFYGHIGEMALDKISSHVVDCIWSGTHGLAFIRERIAEELAENEAALRDVPCGRAVWRNWKMDIYKRRRTEWIRQSKIKASNDGFQSFSELDQKHPPTSSTEPPDAGPQKTPLELARERHMRAKSKSGAPAPARAPAAAAPKGRRTTRAAAATARADKHASSPAATAV